ncbi:hypothetical protein PYK79_10645 [Streptomyces sp. ID05-04B]|nr:hypothetical protein [Streptomyces sp. ID05-04B]
MSEEGSRASVPRIAAPKGLLVRLDGLMARDGPGWTVMARRAAGR